MQRISGGALTSIHRTTPGFAEALYKVEEVTMNTSEPVRRIDDSMEMGREAMADRRADDSGGQGASGRVRSFCDGIKVQLEEVHGDDTHPSHEVSSRCRLNVAGELHEIFIGIGKDCLVLPWSRWPALFS
jgi:hypothetical protein